VVHFGEKINAYTLLVRKPVGRRPLGKPICIWKIIKSTLKKYVSWDVES
jgi:hypothetical protein